MAFYIGVDAYAIIVHTRADQLLPQLLMEQFEALPIQCRHMEHIQLICMKEFGSEKIFFDKMTPNRAFAYA